MTNDQNTDACLARISADRILPVIVCDDATAAAPLGDALTAGGLRTVEVTLRTPAALAVIKALSTVPELLVGAGTVVSAAQVEQAVDAGARFVVSPGFSAAVVRRCQELGIPVIPGVATATEVMTALDAGLSVVKFFPAGQLGGVPMVKALAAPFPGLRLVPTGGVNPDNLRAYLELPAVLAVGGTWLATRELIAGRRWDEVTRLARLAGDVVRNGVNR